MFFAKAPKINQVHAGGCRVKFSCRCHISLRPKWALSQVAVTECVGLPGVLGEMTLGGRVKINPHINYSSLYFGG